jgi:hypothetical protein
MRGEKMDNQETYDADLLARVENIGAAAEKLFRDQYLNAKQRAMFDDLQTLDIFIMQPNQRDDYICQVIDALANCEKFVKFGDEAIEPIKPHYLGMSFGMN